MQLYLNQNNLNIIYSTIDNNSYQNTSAGFFQFHEGAQNLKNNKDSRINENCNQSQLRQED